MNNIVVSSTTLPNGKRIKPTVKQLKEMVDHEMDWMVAEKREFTAYNITLFIRKNNPGFEIVHEDVRHYVHNRMDKYNVWSKHPWGYTSATVNYNGEDATTYSPMLQTVMGSVAQSAQPKVKVSKIKPDALPDPNKDPNKPTANTPSKKSLAVPNKALPAPNQIRIDWGED